MVVGKKKQKKIIMIIDLLRSNYELLFYLSIFYSIYILYNKWRDLIQIIKSPIKLNNNGGNWNKKFFYYLAFLLIVICIYYIFNKLLGINNINNNEYRTIKLALGFSISILTLFINIKEKGLKSWRTIFSIFSLCFLILYVSFLFDDEWKNSFYAKLNSCIIGCSIWICIFFSFFSHEYLYLSGIDIANNLKVKIFKLQELELINKPNMMKIEDLLNKGDSIQSSSDQTTTKNIPYNRVKVEDLLNKEELNNSNKDKNSNIKITNELSLSNKKENPGNILINDLSESNKNKSSNSVVSKIDINNDINTRPSSSDSMSSASVMSQDSTISKAHICVVQGTDQLVKAAELFTNQWKEGKILDESAKEKKEMLDEILDLPDDKVFDLLKYRLNWERNSAMTRYINKRNMPLIPKEELLKTVNAEFNETMSNKEKKQKFWARLKAYLKEPIKDENENNFFNKIKKDTLSQYVKGEEEEIIRLGKDKNNSLRLGGQKLKRGGLIAVYEDKKVDAEVAFQQGEIRAMNAGREVKGRILPGFGRMSIFEIMNQSIGSVINEFKKLNLDSSTSANVNNDIKTNSVKSLPNVNEDPKVNVNDSSISTLDNNDINKSKSVLIKGDNNELNKKRRIN
jgi:hypothetical protein